MRLLPGLTAVLGLALVVQACSTGAPTTESGAREVVGTVAEAITAACNLNTIGLPCDPDGPGQPRTECEGACGISTTGLVACNVVPLGTLNGVICGTSNGVGDAACSHVCSGKTCLVGAAPAGTACRPDVNSSPCAGQCNGAGKCDLVAGACPFGRDEQLCTFNTCSLTNAMTCKTKNLPVGTRCSDADACSIGKCDALGACLAGPIAGCDDGNPCTDDACDPQSGACLGTKDDTNTCSDGNACTTGDYCSNGGCKAGQTPLNCDDNNACTADSCDPNTGCAHVAKSCADGDACTADLCDPATGGCSNPLINCDDSDACTADACDSVTGCSHTPMNCDDADACTADSCAAGVCGHTAISCDDNDPCTTDACDVGSGCSHVAIPCDDNDACTVDSCAAGACEHVAASCDDNDPCTIDACAPASGCSHTVVVDCGAGGAPGNDGGAPGAAGNDSSAAGEPAVGGTAATGGSAGSGAAAGGDVGGSANGGSATGGSATTGAVDGNPQAGAPTDSTPGTHTAESSGCGCKVPSGPAQSGGAAWTLGLLGAVAFWRRRRAA